MSVPRDLDRLNDNLAPFMVVLGGHVAEFDAEQKSVLLTFNVGKQFCHSGDIVQGGFITAMLDAAMTHSVFACDDQVVTLSSLEISTRYLEVTRAGPLKAVGRIVRLSYKMAFLDGQLFDHADTLLATTHSVAKVFRKTTNP